MAMKERLPYLLLPISKFPGPSISPYSLFSSIECIADKSKLQRK
jgi:hypothetical protein